MKLWELEKGRKVRVVTWEYLNYVHYNDKLEHWFGDDNKLANKLIGEYIYSEHWEYYEESLYPAKTNKEIIDEIKVLINQLEVKLCLKEKL